MANENAYSLLHSEINTILVRLFTLHKSLVYVWHKQLYVGILLPFMVYKNIILETEDCF